MLNDMSSSAGLHQTARISTRHQAKHFHLGRPSTRQSELQCSFQSQARRNEFFGEAHQGFFLPSFLLLCHPCRARQMLLSEQGTASSGGMQVGGGSLGPFIYNFIKNRCLALRRWMDVHSVRSQLSWAQDPRRRKENPAPITLMGLQLPSCTIMFYQWGCIVLLVRNGQERSTARHAETKKFPFFLKKKSGSQRKWKMSSQSSRTNVSCVNPTARLFCFLVPPTACYFGIIKESFPRYHSQPRWPCLYLREAASQRWDLELLNGLSFPHTVCIWNTDAGCRTEPPPQKNQIKSNQDSHRERPVEKMQTFTMKYCGWNGVLGGGPAGGNTDIIARFFFCVYFLGGRFLFLYFIFRLTENMAAWFGPMWHVHLPVGHQEVGKSVGWLAAQQVTQQRQTAVGTQTHWVTQRGAEAGGRNGMWQQMRGWKKRKKKKENRSLAAAGWMKPRQRQGQIEVKPQQNIQSMRWHEW